MGKKKDDYMTGRNWGVIEAYYLWLLKEEKE